MAPDADRARQRELVGAFFAAARGGDFDALLAVLDPEIVLRADATAVRFGAAAEVRGAAAVAGTFKGRAAAARVAIVNGVPGGAWVHDGKPRVVFNFTISRGKIVEIYLVGDPESVARLDLTIVEDDASPAPTPT